MPTQGQGMFQQLELDFASVLASAFDEPEQADIALMCESLDLYLEGRSHREQLRVAGDAIKDMAEVCFQRAEMLIQDWEDRHNTEGPVMDEDFLLGMTQQTMHLDISDLCRQPKSRKSRQGFTGVPVESVVGEISKDAVLEFVEDLESGEAVALKASHEEDVSRWVSAIGEYLEEAERAVSFADLVKRVRLSMVEVWVGFLLREFKIEQTGDFYDQLIFISGREL